MKSFKQFCKEHIVKTGSGYKLVSKKTGRNLGEYPSKDGAEKRERQVQYFKHQSEETLWETADKKDRISFDIPLMIRVLELAREDIKSDMDLHRVVERLIDIRNKGVLTMDDYDFIANIKEQYVKEDGMGAGAIAVPGPTNTTGSGQVAGMGQPVGSKSGEPGVHLKKKKAYNPVMMGMGSRKPPKV
jgi:hypothetical protein